MLPSSLQARTSATRARAHAARWAFIVAAGLALGCPGEDPAPAPAVAPLPPTSTEALPPPVTAPPSGGTGAIDRAWTDLLQGRYEEAELAALAILERAEAHGGQDGSFEERKAAELLGRVYTETGRYEDAERILQRSALSLEQFNADNDLYWGCPYQALGALYAQLGQQGQAASFYTRAADLEPDNAHSQYQAAQECLAAGDAATALTYTERALAAQRQAAAEPGPRPQTAGHEDPLPRYLALEGFVLLLLQRYDDAQQRFDSAQALAPDLPDAAVGLGHLAIVNRHYDSAEQQLGAVLRVVEQRLEQAGFPVGGAREIDTLRDPRRFDNEWLYELAQLGLAWTAANQSQHARAIAHYEQVLLVRPAHLLARIGMANSLSGLQRLDEAQGLLEVLHEEFPTNPYVLAELALIHYNRSEDELAERRFREALEQDDGAYTCPHEGLGLVYLRRGETEQARGHFERAIEINPDVEYKKYNGLAKIHIENGELDKAAALLRKSIENYPYDPEARELLEGIAP